MAIWEQINTLDLPERERLQLHDIYAKGNLLDVRALFANWIEETPWHTFEKGNVDHEMQIKDLFARLLKKIEEKTLPQTPGNNLMDQMKFINLKQTFKDMYGNNLWRFVDTLKNMLETEKNLIDSLTKPPIEVDSPKSPSVTEINEFIDFLKNLCKEEDAKLKEYKQNQEKFVIEYQQFSLIEVEILQIQNNTSITKEDRASKLNTKEKEKEDIKHVLMSSADQLLKEREEVFKQLKILCENSRAASTKAIEEVVAWQIMQQKSLSGGERPGDLAVLQEWFENLADLFWSLYQMISTYKILFDALPIIRQGNENEELEQLVEATVHCLTLIIKRSFIVEKQPPQVLKTQTKFQSSVRLLVGGKLNLQFNCPSVKATIVSEKQAKEIVLGQPVEKTVNCGDLLNSECVMQYDNATRIFSAEFKNLSLKKIKRQDRRGQEVVSVLEAKSSIVFTAGISISGKDLPVTCMSFPVVVVVHGNQGPSSEATVFWDNMFSKADREPFDVPEVVSWDEMEVALNARWSLTCERELDQAHMQYIKLKLAGDLNANEVTWAQFNREPLKDRSFTFWEWFYAAMEVVKKHVKEHWKHGYIEFISRDNARQRLVNRENGTFLIRFSDGELGGVSIAWTVQNKLGTKEVWNLQPFTSRDFNIRSLADSIFDIEEIKTLYPDISKENAFGEYRTQNEPLARPDQDEYVKTLIKRDLGIEKEETKMESPVSPIGYQTPYKDSVVGPEDGLMLSNVDPDFCAMDSCDSLPKEVYELLENYSMGKDEDENMRPEQRIQSWFSSYPSSLNEPGN